jgi:BirA family biotin operon repressor/biotin-[acetyl-CoA-carboxylase] ligase
MTDAPEGRPPLDASRLPGRVAILDEAGSTNAIAAERARTGCPSGLVVATEHQTAGRGRLDRVWEVPPRAAVTFSMVVRTDAPAESWPWIPLLTGYAVHAALVDRVPALGLKWPNDVLVDDARKLAGILVERVETADGPAAVIGIGINVSQTREELAVPGATSLALEVEGEPDRTEVLAGVIASLDALLPLLEDTESLRRAYCGECVTLGKRVRVAVPAGDPVEGTAVEIDSTGRLVVETAGGPVAVGAGDVVHVRAADQ